MTVEPEREQIVGVMLVRVTVSGDEVVALNANGAVPKALSEIAVKVMLWSALAITTVVLEVVIEL